MRCPYSINSAKKHFVISCYSTWFLKLSTQQIRYGQRRSKSPSTEATNEDWYPGYHPAWTQKDQGRFRYDLAHHPEHSRGLCHAPQDINNYIYKNICKIGKERYNPD
jgi:hypothetical protein